MKMKFYFEQKRLIFVSVLAVLLGIIYSFSSNIINSGNSVSEVYESIVGYNDYLSYGLSNLQGVIILFILSIPIINYYEKNLSKVNVYIFTRIKSKNKFFTEKFLFLSLFSLISSVLYISSKMIFSECFILNTNLILCFINLFLSLLIFSGSVCLISVFIGCSNSYLVMVIVYSILIFAVTMCYYNCNNVTITLFIILNPCARYMLNWNNEYYEMLNDFQMKLMSPYVSIAYYSILLLIYFATMNITIKHFNISLKNYDEE